MLAATKDWLASYPAVRLQHRPDSPIGKGLECWQDPDGSTWVKSEIVDPAAQRLVRKGVLRAYSVGIANPQTQKSARAPRYEIVGGRLIELSVVDSPANARCGVEIVGKSAAGVPVFLGKAWKRGKDGKPKYTGKPFKINTAHQALYDDPEAMQAWLPKRAEAILAGAAEEWREFRNPALVGLADSFLESLRHD